ncbi:MAG: DUF2975 domain-containing protein [Clostridia bacterium]|nr:DUF2975 domain-containing protein [Clostridia bacterium]
MNTNNTMKSLTVIAARLDTFFKVMQKIAQIGLTVLLVAMLVLTIVNAVDPDAVIGTDLNSMDVGPLTFTLAPEYAPENENILGFAWVMTVIALVCGGTMVYGMGIIRRILQPMKEGRPFAENTAAQMKKLAFCALALGIAQNIGVMVEAAAALKTFGVDQIMEMGVIRSVTVNYTMELGFVVVFFVLLLTSYLFAYGAQLQQLSDETL